MKLQDNRISVPGVWTSLFCRWWNIHSKIIQSHIFFFRILPRTFSKAVHGISKADSRLLAQLLGPKTQLMWFSRYDVINPIPFYWECKYNMLETLFHHFTCWFWPVSLQIEDHGVLIPLSLVRRDQLMTAMEPEIHKNLHHRIERLLVRWSPQNLLCCQTFHCYNKKRILGSLYFQFHNITNL